MANNQRFVMVSAFRPENTFENNKAMFTTLKAHLSAIGFTDYEVCVGCWEGEHELSLKVPVRGLGDALRISEVARLAYQQDCILYVDEFGVAVTFTYDVENMSNASDYIGLWKRVPSIEGLNAFTATKDGFYAVM